jgi:hypothetical protein
MVLPHSLFQTVSLETVWKIKIVLIVELTSGQNGTNKLYLVILRCQKPRSMSPPAISRQSL